MGCAVYYINSEGNTSTIFETIYVGEVGSDVVLRT